MIHTVFPIMVFFEVAIESSPEGHLNPRPLNSVQILLLTELSGDELNWDSDQLCTAIPSSQFAQRPVSFQVFSSSVAIFILIEFFLR